MLGVLAKLAVQCERSRLNGERTRRRPRLLRLNPHAHSESLSHTANTKPVGAAPTLRTSVSGVDDSCIVSDHRHLGYSR
jgi:hypothetical protein